MAPFQHFDDDDYTDEQRAGMIKALRGARGKPTRYEIIRSNHLHAKLRGVDDQVVALEKARLTDLYREKEREWMKVANERAMYSIELGHRRELAKHGISVEEYWDELSFNR